jgi:hypothetical protein
MRRQPGLRFFSIPQAPKTMTEITGGCLCGTIRYRLKDDPIWVAYCHCQSCRRATGAPVTAYAGFRTGQLSYLATAPAQFHSSPGVTRSFCDRCGTPLSFEGERWPDQVHIHVGTVDQPELLQPQSHVFFSEHVAWLEIADQLPRGG